MNLDYKENKLIEILKGLGNCAIAFSGGTDSTLLLYYLSKLKINSKAYTFHSYLYPEDELTEAVNTAKALGINHEIIKLNPLDDIIGIENNPKERCYICKKYMFSYLIERTRKDGMKYIIEGSNFDDRSDFRPGKKAVQELNILSPLDMAELTKSEIRSLLKKAGLNYTKPSFACYFSRFNKKKKITKSMINIISKCETFIHNLGLNSVRVRYHDNIARLEANQQHMNEIILNKKLKECIIKHIKEQGFLFVVLDLEEYKTGSMNRTL